jgi:hypothetical protein
MLYHCSNKYLNELLPKSEWVSPNGSTINVIYASHNLAYALPFGLSYQPQSKWELRVKNGSPYVYVYKGRIIHKKPCWLYGLNERYFTQINAFEWICEHKLTDFEISRIKSSIVLDYVPATFTFG